MNSSIGDRIRILRKTNKLKQIQFANLIGVSQGTLSELEQDKYKPSLIKGQELNLISAFRDLNQNDKDEILEFIKLKSSRY